MKVTFNFTKRDCFNLNFYILKRFFFLYFFIFLIFSFILGIITKSFTKSLLFPFMLGSIIYSIIIALILFLLLLFIVVFKIFFSSGYKVGVLCEHVIEIDENGITESTSVNRDFRSWDAIYRIKQNKKYVFIFVSKYMCHAIPKNSFVSVGAFNYFYGNLIAFWKKFNFNTVL